jgi:hypothetical protein
MAYLKDRLALIEKMKQLNTVCYSVYEPDGKTRIDENDNPELDPEQARDQMNLFLDSVEGTIKVVLRGRSKKDRASGGNVQDNYTYNLRIGNNDKPDNTVSGLNNPIIGYIEQIYATQLEMMKKDLLHAKEIDDLKKESEQDNSFKIVKEILSELKPYLPLIAQQMSPGFIAPAPGIAGNENDVVEEKINPEQVKRLQIALSRLLKIDQNFVVNLEKLADFAERFPGDYNTIIPMLEFKLSQPK